MLILRVIHSSTIISEWQVELPPSARDPRESYRNQPEAPNASSSYRPQAVEDFPSLESSFLSSIGGGVNISSENFPSFGLSAPRIPASWGGGFKTDRRIIGAGTGKSKQISMEKSSSQGPPSFKTSIVTPQSKVWDNTFSNTLGTSVMTAPKREDSDAAVAGLSSDDPVLSWSALDPSQYEILAHITHTQPQYKDANVVPEAFRNLDLGHNIKVKYKVPKKTDTPQQSPAPMKVVKEPSLRELAASKPVKKKEVKKSSESDLNKLLASHGMIPSKPTAPAKAAGM